MASTEFIPGSREFKFGDRVRISDNHHWAQGATGTIAEPTDQIRRVYGDWNNLEHEVASIAGTIRCYWVKFDEAHPDADGHGPYEEGGIDSRFIEPLPTEG